jgi:PAS domain-containing protein
MAILPNILPALLGGGLAGLLALAAVLWLAPRPKAAAPVVEAFSEPRVFLFRDGYLVEHSENAGFLIGTPVDHLRAWDDLCEALADIADGAAEALAALRDAGHPLRMEGRFGRDRLMIVGVREGDDVRVTVASAEIGQSAVRMDIASLTALEAELAMLTRAHATTPALSWTTDSEKRVTWANRAYLDLVARCHGPDAAHGWPILPLFPEGDDAPNGPSRRRLVDREGKVLWHEVTVPPPSEDGLSYGHAVSLEAAIRAEDGRRAFIQTLTKTFAFLPIGIAIFDADGQLAQFNPALMDMTGLDPEWLSRHPRMVEVFDALRERQRLPEPRDYKAWRDGIANMARDETPKPYRETWTLPGGAIYRMTARPDRDGSVTLLLEDISADVSATWEARIERDTLRGMLDETEEAFVAFDENGARMVGNAAARTLWLGETTEEALLPSTLEGCIDLWQRACRPSPAWGDLRSMVNGAPSERAAWTESLRHRDGSALEMHVVPLPGQRLSIGFRSLDAAERSERADHGARFAGA